MINDATVFIWYTEGTLNISIGASYTICEADVAAAEAVERVRSMVKMQQIDPPSDTKHYICPKYYPAFFTA